MVLAFIAPFTPMINLSKRKRAKSQSAALRPP
jgi:hypothetical protein